MGEGVIQHKLQSHGPCGKCRGERIMCCVFNMDVIGFRIFDVKILLYCVIKIIV